MKFGVLIVLTAILFLSGIQFGNFVKSLLICGFYVLGLLGFQVIRKAHSKKHPLLTLTMGGLCVLSAYFFLEVLLQLGF